MPNRNLLKGSPALASTTSGNPNRVSVIDIHDYPGIPSLVHCQATEPFQKLSSLSVHHIGNSIPIGIGGYHPPPHLHSHASCSQGGSRYWASFAHQWFRSSSLSGRLLGSLNAPLVSTSPSPIAVRCSPIPARSLSPSLSESRSR